MNISNKRKMVLVAVILSIIIFLLIKTFTVFAFQNPKELIKESNPSISALYYDSEQNNGEQLIAFKKLSGVTTLSNIHIRDNGDFTIKYNSKILNGNLNIYVVDKDNNIINEIPSNKSGSMVINSNNKQDFSIKICAKKAIGTIELKIIPEDNLDIRYNNKISNS